MTTGLILTGGGARAAYQVGVLKAIAELLPDKQRNPFPIICGTSAGAINAASLAVFARDYGVAIRYLIEVWENFHAHHVYRSDALGIARTGAHWLGALMAGWVVKTGPKSLLDNAPLAGLLKRNLDLEEIGRSLEAGALDALCITASGYTSGQSVNFYQCRDDIAPWARSQRVACRCPITHAHLLASSAIPFVFPAVKINREYFGDGSMRQLAPISPAIHLGASRVLVVGAGRIHEPNERVKGDSYPSLAQIAGHAMSSIFLDSLNVDIERVQRVNRTISLLPDDKRSNGDFELRPVEVLVIAPSERLDALAAEHVRRLPWPVRALLRGIGAMNRRGSALASYLLFEREYTRALIDLGYQDTMHRAEEVQRFLLA
ncbi:MAG TPA: patatin-like phospholipase family protein [Burkholderiales bacterium]|jgi:NTE family protein